MNQTIRKSAKVMTWLCTLVYFASYTMRLNFAVMLVKVCSELNVEKSAVAIVVTCFTVTYGVGQIVCGFIADKIKPQYLLSTGIFMASICNFTMFLSTSIPMMATAWALNGFANALFWPPIVKLFSVYMNEDEYSYGVVRVSWGSSIGTIVLYLLCPALLTFMKWRQIILCYSIFGMIIFAVWQIVYPKIFVNPLNIEISRKTSDTSQQETSKKQTVKMPYSIYIPLAFIMTAIIFQGMLRDGVTNWMPSFLLESFQIPEEKAIVATVILSVFSMISFWLFERINTKFFKNEVNCATFTFSIAVTTSAILYILNKTFSSVLLSMLLMAVIVACMHGINLMLIGIVPKRFTKVGKTATFSGILNAGTYIGSSISTYGFAVLAEKFGWGFTIMTWVIISALGIVACKFAIAFGWTKKYQEYLN